MKKILVVLLLGMLAAALPSYVIADNGAGVTSAGPAPFFAPPVPFGPAFRLAPLLHPASSVAVAPIWRERSEWEKRRTDQWSELEWQRQQWRETHGEATRMESPATQEPISATSF